MPAPKTPQGPLDWRVPIVNSDGTPTSEFMRKWNLQVGINTGIPTTAKQLSAILDLLGVDQGDIIYRDVDEWKVLEAGAARTLLTSEGATHNPDWVSLSAHLDDLGSARGDLLYRAAAAWTTLAASTPGDILVTEGTGGDPLWATIAAVLDFISSTRGSVLFRGASGWTALAPGTSGNILTTHGAGADPTWAAAAASGVTSYFGTGAPVTLHTNGDLYFDTTAAPYVEYVQNAGAWVQVAGGSSGGATTYARPVAQAAWAVSSGLFATKGNYIKLVEDIVVDAIYVGMGSGAAGRVIEATISQLTTPTSGIVAAVIGRASATTVGATATMLKITFSSPVTMVAGNAYIVAASQTNAASGVTPLGIQAVGTGVNGFPNYGNLPLDNTQLLNNETYQLAKTAVAVADTFTLFNNAAVDIMVRAKV